MSNFGLFFMFALTDLPTFWHASYKLTGRHFSLYFFFHWFSLRFREIMHSKNVNLPSGFLCSSFVEGETKEALCFYNVFFLHACTLYLENEKKTSEKNTEKCFPINL